MASVSLAEPRRRQKWTLNPRGNLWANDESKFGQKLMEKMGWEKGKGLGSKQDGMVNHITLKQKDNLKGIGFEGHDDTWLAHQDDFQNLLAALNVEHGEAGKNMNEDEKKASLSEISKKSKRRVHYQKFVKGKDSSNYSADDLGCILGTKSEKLKSKSEPSSPKTELAEETQDDEKFVQRGSYADYFAQKMAALKAQGKFKDVPAWTDASNNSSRVGLGALVDKSSVKEEDENLEPICDQNSKKKKKSKKSKDSEIPEEVPMEEKVKKKKCVKTDGEEDDSVIEKKSKKKKERKIEVSDETINEGMKEKKNKHEKAELSEDCCPKFETSIIDTVAEVSLKGKKKKKLKKQKDVEESLDTSLIVEENAKKKKTKKSKKEKALDTEMQEVTEDSGCENEIVKIKKSKKGKKEKVKDKKPTHSDEEKENLKRKKQLIAEDSGSSESKKLKLESSTSRINNSDKLGFKGSNLLEIEGYGVDIKKKKKSK